MHSCARDVEIVIVDGVVREERWELVAVDVGGEGSGSVRYLAYAKLLRKLGIFTSLRHRLTCMWNI
jgi:hypothetical protein